MGDMGLGDVDGILAPWESTLDIPGTMLKLAHKAPAMFSGGADQLPSGFCREWVSRGSPRRQDSQRRRSGEDPHRTKSERLPVSQHEDRSDPRHQCSSGATSPRGQGFRLEIARYGYCRAGRPLFVFFDAKLNVAALPSRRLNLIRLDVSSVYGLERKLTVRTHSQSADASSPETAVVSFAYLPTWGCQANRRHNGLNCLEPVV